MKPIIVTEGTTLINIGKQGENNAVRVLFRVGTWLNEYGEGGTFTLDHKRATDSISYPVTTELTEDGVLWLVSAADNANAGYGECELKYSIDEVIKKSVTWRTFTAKALSPTGGTPPDPFESWYENILEAGEEAEGYANAAEAAQIAAQSAQVAAEANARTAGQYAENAEDEADKAETARIAIENMTVTSETVAYDEEASVTKTEVGGVVNLHFEIPQGEPGEKGDIVTAGDGIEVVDNEVSLNKTFYDYLVRETFEVPAISLTIAVLSGAHEIGTAVTVSDFAHRETHADNLRSGTLKLYRQNAEVQTVTPSESTTTTALSSPITEAGTEAGSVTYKLQGTDTLGNARSASVTGTWYRYAYSRVGSPDVVPTSASQCVKQTNINTFATNGADFTYTVGSCLWLLTTKANAKIQTNVLGQWADVTTHSAGAVSFTQANGATATYYAYRTDTFTGAGTAKYRVT